ncbi:MAG TPA: hypothetical protein VHZ96_01945 [Frankiaceae bacterium]|jgi:hypothetical protein|nr:hypothetical protein [Frankiaceae bacterium]
MYDIHDAGPIGSDVHDHSSLHDLFGHDTDLAPLHTAADPWTIPASTSHDSPSSHLGSDATSGMAGNPDEYHNEWFFQGADGLCAPSSITEVLAEHAGVHLPDNQVVESKLSELGFPATFLTMEQSQEALQSLGVPCHLENAPAGNEQATLEQYLSSGHSVILAVNASPIWYGSETFDNPSGGEDHALVVSAIDPHTGEVTLSDPGTPDGNEEHVSWATFQDAWSASDFKMIVTDDAAGGPDHSTAANAVTSLQSGGDTPPAPPAADPVSPAIQPAVVTPAQPTMPTVPHIAGQGFPHIPGPILLPITFGAAAAAAAALRPGRKTRAARRATTLPVPA